MELLPMPRSLTLTGGVFRLDDQTPIILLNTPVSPTFRRWESKRQKDINRQVLERLLDAYPEVDYLDLEADVRFDDADFYDGDHLNTEGATKLTDIVRQFLSHSQKGQ